jgi:hypothetical protein
VCDLETSAVTLNKPEMVVAAQKNKKKRLGGFLINKVTSETHDVKP